MFYGLNKLIKKLLPKQLFYRALLIVAAPIIILQITISVVHPGAIQEQNPYLALDPSNSIQQGSIVLTE